MAFLTRVLAAARRGDSTSCRRAALRTRFRPDGVRAPVSPTRSSGMIGAISVIAWVMTVGFAVSIVPALLSNPTSIEPAQILGLLVVGVSNNVGLLLTYAALTVGRISIVAPIVATEG